MPTIAESRQVTRIAVMRIFRHDDPTLNPQTHSAAPYCVQGALILSHSFRGPHRSPLDKALGETIVDILRIWDCESQCWIIDAPLLIRLANRDLVLWAYNDRINYSFTAVETSAPIAVTLGNTYQELERNSTFCLCWRRQSAMSQLLGQDITAVCPHTLPSHNRDSSLTFFVKGVAPLALHANHNGLSTVFSGGPHGP